MEGQFAEGTARIDGAPETSGTAYTAIAAGGWHSVALKSDGSLWANGENLNGRLGDSSTVDSHLPKQIGTGYTAIAAGRYHTVALKSDGSLWAWGYNGQGELGDGTATDSHVPKEIGTGFCAIAAGGNHTVALKSDGSLWAWGNNLYGQLGDGSKINSHVPKEIGTGYAAIAAGGAHTLALRADGSLWAWGGNWEGQLGDGTTTDSHLPKLIGSGSAELAPPDAVTPSMPAGLTATAVSSSQINLAWSAPPDGAAVASYKVYRDGVLAANVGRVTHYSDVGLAAATGYSYTLAACDAAGHCTAHSGAATATTLATPIAPDLPAPPSQGGANDQQRLCECLFNWAETNYPALFAPRGTQSQNFGPYYLRYYAHTNAYIVVSADNGHLYYLGPLSANALVDMGVVSTWYARSGCG